jgi:hypothetical protein
VKWVVVTFSFPGSAGSTPRVAVWRRLKRLGAVSPRHGLYVLPAREECLEAAQWLSQEVEQGGGDALVLRVEAFEGLSDDELVAQFDHAAAERYAAVQDRLSEIRARLGRVAEDPAQAVAFANVAGDLERAQAEFDDAARADYFGSSAGRETAAALEGLRTQLAAVSRGRVEVPKREIEAYRGRVWVTRPRPYIDRTACAWLVRRFIDPDAEIRYRSKPQPDEVPFDMPSGEFRHVGNLCTFEVMLEAFGLAAPGLVPIAEIVHEIDLRDGRSARPETHGVEAVLSGWHSAGLDDQAIERAALALFDGLYGRFHRSTPRGRGRTTSEERPDGRRR